MTDARDGLCARGKPPGAALRCHLRRFSQGAPFGGGRWLDGQAPRRRPRRSSWLSSGGVPALPSSASRRETPQARPTRVGLRDTSHNTLCPKDPDPVGPGGACASAAKALQVLLQPDREATVTGNSVCVYARARRGYCTARAPNIKKTWAGLKGQQASSSGRRDSQPSLLPWFRQDPRAPRSPEVELLP